MSTITDLWTNEQLAQLDLNSLPRHIAIIPDGNRRWAKNNGEMVPEGQREGADNLLHIVKACQQVGIPYVTFYLFSTENWQRPPEEIETYFMLLRQWLIQRKQELIDNGIRFFAIGDYASFPLDIQRLIKETEEATSIGKNIELICAFNYGARNELVRAFGRILQDCQKGVVSSEQVSESMIHQYLDTARWPDPDLWIRTSGERRLSNFLLWQISYTELYFSKVYWPDFRTPNLLEALYNYQSRERRLGGGE